MNWHRAATTRNFTDICGINCSPTGWWEGEIWNRKKDGSHYLEWLNIKVVRDLRGAITNYIGVFADIKNCRYSTPH